MSQATEQVEIGTGPPAEIEGGAPGHAVARTGDTSSIDDLMRLAMERGEDAVDALERLIALRERVEDRNAERAMAEAMASFQQACPQIRRDEKADVRSSKGSYSYRYASLDEIARTIRPVLAEHGLSYTHDGEVGERAVTVTCTLRHVAGGTRTATFTGPIDTSGGKNPIQQVASARSYGRRYTLIDVLGLTTEDDDDGHAAGVRTITESQAADLKALAEEVEADIPAFLGIYAVESFGDLPADVHAAAVGILERRRARTAAETDA